MAESNLSDNRKAELDSKVKNLVDRYERSFSVKISNGEILEIVQDMFEDNRKNFVKSLLGPITFADRDYLVTLFKTRDALEKVLEEENGESRTSNKRKKAGDSAPAASEEGSGS